MCISIFSLPYWYISSWCLWQRLVKIIFVYLKILIINAEEIYLMISDISLGQKVKITWILILNHETRDLKCFVNNILCRTIFFLGNTVHVPRKYAPNFLSSRPALLTSLQFLPGHRCSSFLSLLQLSKLPWSYTKLLNFSALKEAFIVRLLLWQIRVIAMAPISGALC